MSKNISLSDPLITQKLNELIQLAGEDTDQLPGQLIRQMMHTALRLVRDGADTGERKLLTNSFRELRYALKVFRRYDDVRKISIFGSARTTPDHPDYQTCVQFAKLITEQNWMTITGAGDGIMRAGHEGAGTAKSFGVGIKLPFETNANDFIEGDPKLITFRYFFTRKLVFVSQADAMALFPGGFGTLDEAFEVLTLIQTGKSPLIPIVMIEPPENDYWQQFDIYVREKLLAKKLISPPDLHLYHLFNDAHAAARHICDFYRNFHSQRYVRGKLVLRIKTALTEKQIDQLNDEFTDLIVDGKIKQSDPLEGEVDHLELPRLSFMFNRRDYGRLRLLIDRVNEFALA
jgi:uncharacterized protein (TIGR00730 family)